MKDFGQKKRGRVRDRGMCVADVREGANIDPINQKKGQNLTKSLVENFALG